MKYLRFILVKVLTVVLYLSSFSQTNGALDFDRVNTPYVPEHVTVPGINASSFSGLTIEAWLYLKEYNTGAYTGSYVFGKEGLGCGDPYGSFVLLVTSSNHSGAGSERKLDFGLDPGGVHTALLSNAIISLNQWYHVAATWDSAYMRIYINGEIEDSMAVTGPIQGFDTDMHIGDWNTCSDRRGVKGTIDEARVWNVARTKSQLRETMYSELTGSETGLFAYYKFNDGSGQTAIDSSPNSYDGYLGSVDGAVDDNDPTWVSSTAPMPYYSVQNGNWNTNSTWATGQLVPSTDWAEVKLLHDVTLDGNDSIRDLEIDVAGSLTIAAANQLTVSSTLANNSGVDGLVINSDATGTGSLIESSGSVDGTVNRFLSQSKWHFIGIPVSTATASTFYLSGGSDIYLRTHIESSNSWDSWITNVNTNLLLGRGYECWVDNNINQDETVQFQGTLNEGDYTTGTGSFYDLVYSTGHGLNLISNPYPSALSADINAWTKTNIANSVWVWSGASGNYVYWNGVDGTNGDGFGTLTNGVIPAMQGFFVLATGSNPSLTIPQNSRIHSGQLFYKNSGIISNTLRIEVEGNNYKDVAFVCFDENATNDIDLDFDVLKLFGLDEAPQLFFTISNEDFSINALPELKESMTIELNFECGQEGLFTLDVSDIESSFTGTEIVLEDSKEDVFQNLNENPKYSFSYNPGEEAGRFNLHFKYSNPDIQGYENEIDIWHYDNFVYVNTQNDGYSTVGVVNLQGQEVIPARGFKENTRINVKGLHGFYLVQVVSDNKTKSEKFFIR
jgi:hypothetical protein